MLSNGHEVVVSYYPNVAKCEFGMVSVSFSEEAACVLDDYIKIRVVDDVMYFDPGVSGDGLKLVKGGTRSKVTIQKASTVKATRLFAGCYPLRFDAISDSYYIKVGDLIEVTDSLPENHTPRVQPSGNKRGSYSTKKKGSRNKKVNKGADMAMVCNMLSISKDYLKKNNFDGAMAILDVVIMMLKGDNE